MERIFRKINKHKIETSNKSVLKYREVQDSLNKRSKMCFNLKFEVYLTKDQEKNSIEFFKTLNKNFFLTHIYIRAQISCSPQVWQDLKQDLKVKWQD